MAIAFDWGGFNETITDVVITNGDATITSASNPWVESDVGKTIIVNDAGAGTFLRTYIATFNSAGSVEMGTVCLGGSGSGKAAWWFVGQYKNVDAITSLTWKHVCTGSNRYLIVPVWGGPPPDGCTYNSVAMTLLDSYRLSDSFASLWGLANPASGMNDVVLTYSGAASVFAATSVSYTGVHQSTRTGTAAHAGTGGGGSSSISVNVSSAVDEVVVDCLATAYKTYTITATGTGQVIRSELFPQTGDFSGSNGKVDSSSTPGAATTTVSYTLGGTNYGNICAIPLKPAAGGGDGLMWL